MKKISIICFFYLLTFVAWAEGTCGIFGIEFGNDSEFVIAAMEEKGWFISKTDDTSIVFEKRDGKFLDLLVRNILLDFYEGKFYQASICCTYCNNNNEVISALRTIIEAYSLDFVDEKDTLLDGYSMVHYSYMSNVLFFTFDILYKDEGYLLFSLFDTSLYVDKMILDEEKELENVTGKRKDLYSDL